ncbi:hypothetical protein HGG75_27475 [Ochrobactrum pseudogrignonense]|nr:hypothetical protein [Brucella pseudogrignonensis]
MPPARSPARAKSEASLAGEYRVHKGEQSVLVVNLGERNFFAAPGRSLGVR